MPSKAITDLSPPLPSTENEIPKKKTFSGTRNPQKSIIISFCKPFLRNLSQYDGGAVPRQWKSDICKQSAEHNQGTNCFQHQKAENLPNLLKVFFFAWTKIKGGLQDFRLWM